MSPRFGKLFLLFLAGYGALVSLSDAMPEVRIVGGTKVDISSAPHLVSLRYKHNVSTPFVHRCSGTIYTQHVVLTTARCVIGLQRHRLQVVAGSSYSSQHDGYIYLVNSTVIHPDFNIWFTDNDLALLRLAYPLTTSHPKVIAVIALATQLPAPGSLASVAGWGAATEAATNTEVLHMTTVRLVDVAKCRQAYGEGRISAAMLCAGGASVNCEGMDACQGDAGSALVANGTAVGLVSWGSGCGRVGFPGVYTNLVHFKGWLENEAKQV